MTTTTTEWSQCTYSSMIHDSQVIITQSPLGHTRLLKKDRFLKDSPQENQTNTVLWWRSFDLCFQKQILSVLKVEHFLWAEHKHVIQQWASQSVIPDISTSENYFKSWHFEPSMWRMLFLTHKHQYIFMFVLKLCDPNAWRFDMPFNT